MEEELKKQAEEKIEAENIDTDETEANDVQDDKR
jgi:hypothetical protein